MQYDEEAPSFGGLFFPFALPVFATSNNLAIVRNDSQGGALMSRRGLATSFPPIHPCFRRALLLVLAFLGAGFVGIASHVDDPPPVVAPAPDTIVEGWGVAPAPVLVYPRREPKLVRDLNDPRPWVRGLSAVLLARWGGDDSAPALEGSLFDAHPWVSSQAARSLSVHRPSRSVPALARALARGHVTTRREAARALLRYDDDPMAHAALARAAREDPSPWVVLLARSILPAPPPPRYVHRGRTGPCPL